VAELDGEGNIVSVFVYATRPNVPDLMYSCKDPAAPVAPCDPGAPWRSYRVVSDHLGSVRLVVSLDDATFGEVVQRMDYDEYGVVLTDTAPGFQPFGLAGGMYDSISLLVRFGSRDYFPLVGRWTSKDILLYLVISPNTYNYILNDPLNTFDMSGYGWINDHVNSITKGYKISNNWRIGPRFPKDPPDPKEIPEPKNLDKANPTPPDLENVLRCILVPSQCRSPRKPLHIPCPDNQVPVLPVDVNIPASIFSLPPLHLQLHIDFDIKPPLGPDLRYTL